MKKYIKPNIQIAVLQDDIAKKMCTCSNCDCPDWPPGHGCGCKNPSIQDDEETEIKNTIWNNI